MALGLACLQPEVTLGATTLDLGIDSGWRGCVVAQPGDVVEVRINPQYSDLFSTLMGYGFQVVVSPSSVLSAAGTEIMLKTTTATSQDAMRYAIAGGQLTAVVLAGSPLAGPKSYPVIRFTVPEAAVGTDLTFTLAAPNAASGVTNPVSGVARLTADGSVARCSTAVSPQSRELVVHVSPSEELPFLNGTHDASFWEFVAYDDQFNDACPTSLQGHAETGDPARLDLTGGETGSFGFWQTKDPVAPCFSTHEALLMAEVRLKAFRADGQQVTAATVPEVRVRLETADDQQGDVLELTSNGPASMSPVPAPGSDSRMYRLYSYSTSRTPAVRFACDWVNFEPNDDPATTVALTGLRMAQIPLDSLERGTPIRDFTFGTDEGFEFGTLPTLFHPPSGHYEAPHEGVPGRLVMAVGPLPPAPSPTPSPTPEPQSTVLPPPTHTATPIPHTPEPTESPTATPSPSPSPSATPSPSPTPTPCTTPTPHPDTFEFGWWTWPASSGSYVPIPVRPNYLYEVDFTVGSDQLDPDFVPGFRLRVNTSSFQVAAYATISSMRFAHSVPPNVPTQGRSVEYRVFLPAPPTGDENEHLIISLDCLYGGDSGDSPANLYLERVKVFEIEAPAGAAGQ